MDERDNKSHSTLEGWVAPFADSRRLEVARQSSDLYFASLLDRQTIQSTFGEASGILDSARIYTTAATLWVFLSQVLSADHGCVSAVAKLIHFRCARGLQACSSKTGAYCIARDQLDESAMQRLVTQESYKEELAIYFGLDPYAGDGDISGVASARGNAGQPLSSEIILLVCRRRPDVRKATSIVPSLARCGWTRRSQRPWACADIPNARTGRSHWFQVQSHQWLTAWTFSEPLRGQG